MCYSEVVMTTSRPTNESELQQYRVLERANLLQYYDTFISQGKHSIILTLLTITEPVHSKSVQITVILLNAKITNQFGA